MRPAEQVVDQVLSEELRGDYIVDCSTCGCNRPRFAHGAKGLRFRRLRRRRLESRPFFKVSGKQVIVERDWAAYLDIDISGAEFEDVDPEEAKAKIIEKLGLKRQEIGQVVSPNAAARYEDLINEFQAADDDEESIDYVLQMLYDWADENGVWVGSKGDTGGHYSERGSIEL